MPQRSSGGSGGRLLDVVVIFSVAATIATLLLIAALVLWLAEYIGSLVGALCIVGGTSAFVALCLYLTALRPQIESLHHQMESLAHIGRLLRQGYSFLSSLLHLVRGR